MLGGGTLFRAAELERRRVAAVVTTHLGRLKEFAYSHARAENGAMTFDGETLAPTFRLHVGIPGASHALDIARRVGVPQALVDRAHELIATRDERLESVIEGVQQARQRAEEDRQRTERLSREAESVGAQIEVERREIELRKAWLAEEADAVVDEELRAARELLQNALKPFVNAPRPFGEKAKQLLTTIDGLLRGTSVHRRRMKFVGQGLDQKVREGEFPCDSSVDGLYPDAAAAADLFQEPMLP